MKLLRLIFCIVALLTFELSPVMAWIHGGIAFISSFTQSEVSLSPPGGADLPFLNAFKTASSWTYNDNSAQAKPDELDSNGYILTSGGWTSHGGAKAVISIPTQAKRPGDYVFVATGGGAFQFSNNNGTSALVSCVGTTAGGTSCDNTGCSSFTGSIAGAILTVTAAPTGTGCALGAGVPISGSGVSVSVSFFGTPTIITSAGSACGPSTCYTVNQAQTVVSGTMNMGIRIRVSAVDGVTNFPAQWLLLQTATSTGNRAGNFAMYHIADEAAYWASAVPSGLGQASIAGTLFTTRIKQGGFGVLRDLDWMGSASVSNCTTWSTRKPVSYYSWSAQEARNAASGPGQYVTAGGTGASGGTVSYNAGTDIYSITMGAGGPVDKQTILLLPPATGTTASKISLNGTTAAPVLNGTGSPGGSSSVPTLNLVTTMVYDAVIGGWLNFGGTSTVQLNCPVPPEVFIEINAELKTTPRHTLPFMALDPMTDWTKQYASYYHSAYPYPKPRFEASNEPWQCGNGADVAIYFTVKSNIYIAEDAAWTSGGAFCGASGNIPGEIGKVASTVGQDLVAALGAGNFELACPVQTASGPSAFNDVLRSSAYINQTIAPTQSGYTQTAAYLYCTRISVTDYWNTGYYGSGASSQRGTEVGLAYCYYNYSISSACQGLYASQQAPMDAKMNSSTTGGLAGLNIPSLVGFLAAWNTWGSTCSLGSRPGGCTVNQTSPLDMYEGGFNEIQLGTDVTQTISSATNAGSAVLTITNSGSAVANGCVAGQTVGLSSLAGGTWSTASGSYTVQSATSSTCTINLNSTSLGTLTGGTFTYTGSAGYVNYLRSSAYLQPALDTLTTTVYNDIISNGGINPSQYFMGASSQWTVWSSDIFGYYQLGSCTSCTISSTTLTLGGTIAGVFAVNQTLFGKAVTGVGTGAGSNTTITSCIPIGGNVCGTTAGDTLGLSQASTVSSGTAMTGNVTPPTNNAGNSTTSPVRAWGAICRFNGTGSQCNGWLLKRDIDPESNDNDPMRLEKAA